MTGFLVIARGKTVVRKSLAPTCLIAVVTTLMLGGHALAAPATVPDLTQGGKKDNERDFPDDCKKKKTAAVEEAIKAIEAATDLPEVRSIAPLLRKADPL